MDKTTEEKQKGLILELIKDGFPCRFVLNPYKQGFRFVTEPLSVEFGDLVAVSLLNSLLEEIRELKEKTEKEK